MRKHWPTVVLMSLAMTIPSFAYAQEAKQAGAPAATAEAAVGTSIENRMLGGAAESFPAATQRLWCFSRVMGAAESSQIEHVWYKDSTEVARVPLKVSGSPWRVYSSKNLGENPSGSWRCDVVQDGKVLQSVTFKVE